MSPEPDAPFAPLRWRGDHLALLDQRLLPGEERWLRLESAAQVADAIEQMAVRGAPAIGCAAAFGVALAARAAAEPQALRAAVAAAAERLARTRPTAVNLFWALGRMRARLDAEPPEASLAQLQASVVAAAERLLAEDAAACRALGDHGAALLPPRARVLTHCNAGALATGGWGTALGIVRSAVAAGNAVSVLADETRPFLQGARLTAWELARDRIPVTVLTDGMAGALMQRGEVDVVVVGADRIAANGDVANKVGTYGLAVLARHHRLPFYVAAPVSTLDPATPDGASIPIEERGRAEVAEIAGRAILPEGVPVRHPAFDVTPAELVDAIVTERGVARAPYRSSLARFLRTG